MSDLGENPANDVLTFYAGHLGSRYMPSGGRDTPGTLYAIAIIFTLLAVAATALRFYARSIKKVGRSWDDYAVLPALVCTIATAIIVIIGVAVGDLGRHTENVMVQNPQNLEEWAAVPILTKRTVIFWKVSPVFACMAMKLSDQDAKQAVFATQLTQVLAFGFTKLAVLLFYQRIFQGRWIQRAIWAMVAVDFVWTVGFFFAFLLQCYPFRISWTGLGFKEGYCVNTNRLLFAHMWSDIATNNLGHADVPTAQNFSNLLIWISTVASGIAKLVIYYNIYYLARNNLGIEPTDPILDVSYLQTPLVYWPMIESATGIVGACLPLLRPLFAGAASRGFMRDLQSVDIPTSERSDTLWDKSGLSGPSDGWNSSVSTVRWGSDSLPVGELGEKRLPSLPTSSLNMLRDAPSEGRWAKGPRVHHAMV
ncbi:MAG: hypothetical protein Q9184_006777 [Pyrenodesmia sp. 2 TL-2023]